MTTPPYALTELERVILYPSAVKVWSDAKVIVVTQECITDGAVRSVLGCPIALAVNGDDTVIGSTVGKQTVTIVYEDKFITYALPQVACDFVDEFDLHETGEPFEFCLDIILSQGTEEELWHKKRRLENVG